MKTINGEIKLNDRESKMESYKINCNNMKR